MRRLLLSSYGWLSRRLVPGLRNSQHEFVQCLEAELAERPDWLDIGCGRRPFPVWMEKSQKRCLSRARRIVGIDPDMASLRDHHVYPDKALASGYAIPFRSQSFDLASANMVVEHLENPNGLLQEVRRVLRPHGRFLFHTSNQGNWAIRISARLPDWIKHIVIRLLEDRRPEDVFPTFYRFNSQEAIQREATSAGLRLVSLRFVSSNAFTAGLGPLAFLELLWIRRLTAEKHSSRRSNIMGVLEAVDEPSPPWDQQA